MTLFAGDARRDETARPQSLFLPIRLRYDDAEVDNAPATVEEIVEEDLLEEEEEGWRAARCSAAAAGAARARTPKTTAT